MGAEYYSKLVQQPAGVEFGMCKRFGRSPNRESSPNCPARYREHSDPGSPKLGLLKRGILYICLRILLLQILYHIPLFPDI